MAASGEFAVTEPVPMAAGDATFHAGWTLHRATPNTSNRMRVAIPGPEDAANE